MSSLLVLAVTRDAGADDVAVGAALDVHLALLLTVGESGEVGPARIRRFAVKA